MPDCDLSWRIFLAIGVMKAATAIRPHKGFAWEAIMSDGNLTKQRIEGAMLVLLSGITISTKAILAKLAYRLGADALQVLSLRMFMAVPLLLLTAYFSEKKASARLSKREMVLTVLLGITGYYISSMLDFLGLLYISASLERLVLFLYPTFVVLLAALLFRTPLRRLHVLSLGVTYAGMGIVFHHEQNLSGPLVMKGSLLVLGCSVGYALYLLGAGRLIPKVGAARFNSYSLLSATVAIFVHWIVAGRPLSGLPLPVYGYGLLLATVATVIPTWLLAKGIGLVGSGPAAILTTIGPVSTILLAHFLLGEQVTMGQLVGSVLVLCGVTMVSLRK